MFRNFSNGLIWMIALRAARGLVSMAAKGKPVRSDLLSLRCFRVWTMPSAYKSESLHAMRFQVVQVRGFDRRSIPVEACT